MKDVFEACLIILAALIGLVLSWAITAAFAYVIFLCFGWEYTHLKATGVWLALLFVKDFLRVQGNRRANM